MAEVILNVSEDLRTILQKRDIDTRLIDADHYALKAVDVLLDSGYWTILEEVAKSAEKKARYLSCISRDIRIILREKRINPEQVDVSRCVSKAVDALLSSSCWKISGMTTESVEDVEKKLHEQWRYWDIFYDPLPRMLLASARR